MRQFYHHARAGIALQSPRFFYSPAPLTRGYLCDDVVQPEGVAVVKVKGVQTGGAAGGGVRLPAYVETQGSDHGVNPVMRRFSHKT